MLLKPRTVVAALMALCILLLAPTDGWSAKRKSRRRSRKRPKATAVVPAATGNTLEQRVSSLVNGSIANSSIASVQVVELQSGRVIAERNPTLPVAPASNMKLFTTAAALDLLRPTFVLTTSVYARGKVDPTGTLHGDVKIVGGGDPTIGGRFHDGHAAAVPEQWAAELKRNGIKTIEGSLVFEYGYLDTEYIHPTWPVDQLVNWYEAPISAFSMQEGCVLVRVTPSRPGQKANVTLEPPNTFVTVENSCVTERGGGVIVTRQIGTNNIIVRGGIPTRSGNTDIYVTIQNPIDYFANVTLNAFERSGVHLKGEVRLIARDPQPDWRLITAHRTPLPVIIDVINKKSQNHYAEELIKIIGAEVKKEGSWKAGAAAISVWLQAKTGVGSSELQQIDGSGMSRFNRVSSHAFIALLKYMWTAPYKREFLASMPYTGEPDSRLKHRLNQPPYARQVYAKTGYIVGVIGLSGYVHAQSGKIYAFSFLFNRYRTGVWAVYRLHDEILKEIIRGG
jgi:serine-type D-Ala-D-Ala carboxypeptidase/endopeptidase (penicillin-binding protein 4)